MRPARKHRVTAAFLDIFIIGSLVQVVGTILTSLTSPDAAGLISLPLAAIYILAIIVYHAAFAHGTRFCSPGERIAGCRVTPSGKSWFSIFTRSRWFLFLTVFFLLLLPANAFDAMQRANEYPLPMVMGRSVYVCILLWAITRVAMGRFRWAIAAFIFLALHLAGSIAYLTRAPDLAIMSLVMFGLQALFLLITLVVYKDRAEEPGADGKEQHVGQTSPEAAMSTAPAEPAT